MNSSMQSSGPSAPHAPALRELLTLLSRTSFHASSTPTYPLACGTMSRFYIDCKKGLSHPRVRELAGQALFERIHGVQADAIGGLLIGAYPVAIAVSDAAWRKQIDLSVFVIRKEPKGHGLRQYIEGDVQHGDHVIIVDDVITSGASTVQAIKRSREAGLLVVRALALVDREEAGGREAIEQLGVTFQSLFTLSDFVSVASSETHEGCLPQSSRRGPVCGSSLHGTSTLMRGYID